MILKRAILLAALLIMIANSAYGVDCLMGRYEPEQSSNTSEKLKLPLALDWEYTGNKFDNNPASPVVAGRLCVFSCGDRVYGVDLDTGNLKWRYPSEQGLGGAVKVTPAISGGSVYFAAADGNLYCISADTGTFKWAYQTRGAIRCPPVINDGVVYVGADDNSLYAIDAESGDAVWAKPFTVKDDIATGIAVGSGMIIFASLDGNIYFISENGAKLRQMDRLPSAPTKSSPVIVDNVAIMAVGSIMRGYTVRSGQFRWSINLESEVAATPAVSGSDIYVPCRDKKIYAYTFTGRSLVQKWVKPAEELDAIPMSSPVVAGETLFVTGARGVIAAFSTVDGTLKWRYVIAPSPITTPGIDFTDAASSPTIANGTLTVLTDDGVLHCFSSTSPDNQPPDAINVKPMNGIAMSGAPPITMSAILYDIGSGVDFLTASISLDGQPVAHKVDLSKSTITYETEYGAAGKSVKSLSDGMHVISVTAKDYAGNLLKKEWFFIADSSLPPPRRATVPVEEGKKTKAPATKRPSRNIPTPPSAPGGQGNPGIPGPPPMPPSFGGPGTPPAPTGGALDPTNPPSNPPARGN